MRKYTVSDFIKLKAETFKYCDKTYTAKRYVSSDFKFYITSDDGFNYTMVYKANNEGKADLIYELYYKGNYASYPIYTFEDAINKLNELGIDINEKLTIHASHFHRKL